MAVTHAAADVLHHVALAVAIGDVVRNNDASGLRLVGGISLHGLERGGAVCRVIAVGQLIAVRVGHDHVCCLHPKRQREG